MLDKLFCAIERVTGMGLDWPNGTGHLPVIIIVNPSRTPVTLAASTTLLLLVWLALK